MMSQNMMFKPAQIYEIISVVISQSNSHTNANVTGNPQLFNH